jgi:hypothetical protein
VKYEVREVVTFDNEDGWYPKKRGRWEVVDENGQVVMTFKYRYSADNAEWPEREWWQGPKHVRISDDGKFVECVHQTGVQHGVAFEGTLGEKVERHPLP